MLPTSSSHRASSSAGSRNDIFSARPSASPAPPAPLPPRARRAAPRSWLAGSQHPDALPLGPGHTRVASDSSTPFAAALAARACQPPAPSAPPSASSAASSPHVPSSLPPSSPATPPGRSPGANSIFDLPLGLGLPPPRPNAESKHVRKPSTGRRTEAQRARERARIRHRSDQMSLAGGAEPGDDDGDGDGRFPGGLYVDSTDLSETTPDTDFDDEQQPAPGPHSPPALVPSQPAPAPSTPAAPRTPESLHRTRSRRRRRRIGPVQYRLVPAPEYFLSEGRYCDVYLGSYRVPDGDWTLCAVKRLHADTQSQLVGLDEAYALRRLGKHSGIVQLIDIVDEMPTAPSTHVHHAPLSAPPAKAPAPPPPPALQSQPPQPHEGRTDPDPPRLLILLELLPHSLGTYVSAYPCTVDVRQWLDWGIELADAVAYMHSRGAMHADIKMDNCLLTMDRHLKLCDFNSTLWIDPANLPTDGAGLGTLAYSAPELTSSPDGPGFGFPVDVWAMGVLLYSLASGHAPYERATSMVDLLHRKPHFWQIEESDRARRLALAQGLQELERSSLSRSGTTTASLAGSNPSVHSPQTARTPSRSHSLSHRRGGSSTGGPSQMTVAHGRIPSSDAISTLLAPSSPVAAPDPVPAMPSSPLGGVPGRAASMRAPPGHHTRRTPSGLMINTHLPKRALRTPLSPLSPELGASLALPPRTEPLRAGDTGTDADDEPEMVVDISAAGEEDAAGPPYRDGAPAFLLPGGGRMPDTARDLVRAMVMLDPAARPAASQVAERLRAIREAHIVGTGP